MGQRGEGKEDGGGGGARPRLSASAGLRSGAALLLEAAGALAGAVVIVSAALAFLPGGEGSWLERALGHARTVATLDFGISHVSRRPVLDTVADAAVLSLSLIGLTAALLLLVAGPLGVLAATRPRSPMVAVVRRLVGTLSSAPILVWATLIFLWSAWVLAAPLVWGPKPAPELVGVGAGAVLALLLGDRLLADLMRRVELSAREILAEPYMRTVRAAAFGVRRHLLRSLVPSVADVMVSRFVLLIGGAIVVERVFSIPGLGFTVVDAIDRPGRDPSLVLAAVLALVVIGLFLRLVRQVAVLLSDPRAGVRG